MEGFKGIATCCLLVGDLPFELLSRKEIGTQYLSVISLSITESLTQIPYPYHHSPALKFYKEDIKLTTPLSELSCPILKLLQTLFADTRSNVD